MLVFVPLPEADRTAERTHRYSHIECDVAKCGKRSPPAAEMNAAGGLARMGWFIEGGKHRCPDHYDREDVQGRGPQYRDK